MPKEKENKKTYSEINEDFFKLVSETFYSSTVYTKEQYVQIIFDLSRLVRDMEMIHNEEIQHLRDTLGKKLAQEQFKRERAEENLEKNGSFGDFYYDV